MGVTYTCACISHLYMRMSHMMMGALEVIVGKSYDTNLVVPVK